MFTFGLSVVVWVFAEIMGIDHYKTDVLTGNKNASLVRCFFTGDTALAVSWPSSCKLTQTCRSVSSWNRY